MKSLLLKIKKHAAMFYVGFVFNNYLLGKKASNTIFVEPDYYIINDLSNKSVIIDIGTGDNADLSQDLIKKFDLISYGFDPTRKHYSSLKNVEKESAGKFTIFNFALSDQSGETEFNESAQNVSGSFSIDHINIKNDNISRYPVKTVTLSEIFHKLALTKIDLLKMDVEGEEYKIIDSLDRNLTDKIQQFIIEFHHHCIDKYSILDTLKAIKKMTSSGFEFYSTDGINYLFYKKHD